MGGEGVLQGIAWPAKWEAVAWGVVLEGVSVLQGAGLRCTGRVYVYVGVVLTCTVRI